MFDSDLLKIWSRNMKICTCLVSNGPRHSLSPEWLGYHDLRRRDVQSHSHKGEKANGIIWDTCNLKITRVFYKD